MRLLMSLLRLLLMPFLNPLFSWYLGCLVDYMSFYILIQVSFVLLLVVLEAERLFSLVYYPYFIKNTLNNYSLKIDFNWLCQFGWHFHMTGPGKFDL